MDTNRLRLALVELTAYSLFYFSLFSLFSHNCTIRSLYNTTIPHQRYTRLIRDKERERERERFAGYVLWMIWKTYIALYNGSYDGSCCVSTVVVVKLYRDFVLYRAFLRPTGGFYLTSCKTVESDTLQSGAVVIWVVQWELLLLSKIKMRYQSAAGGLCECPTLDDF